MVSPIYIIAIALAAGFLLTLFDKLGRGVSSVVFLLTLTAMAFIPVSWLVAILSGSKGAQVFTAGFAPPFSINLRMGLEEAAVLSAVNIAALLGGIYLLKRLRESPIQGMVLFLSLFVGIGGMIMTRDLFNLFVFIEITSISTYSILALGSDKRVFSAGFKYMLAGSIASTFFLIGTVYVYRLVGNLNIDFIASQRGLLVGKAGFAALIFLLSGLLIELKSFPVNGWALDVYQTADDGIAAMIAVANSAAAIFALFKILPFFSDNMLLYIGGVGILTFVASNTMGLKQVNTKRLLGYSSIAQMGLILGALALSKWLGLDRSLQYLIVGGLFIGHFLAKAGLFWLAGIVKGKNFLDWDRISRRPELIILMGTFIFSLLGMPPFPAFWAKWSLMVALASHGMAIWIVLILLGSLLESVYLLRWFGHAVRGDSEDEVAFDVGFAKSLPVTLFAGTLLALGLIIGMNYYALPGGLAIPLLAGLVLFLLRGLPERLKGLIALAAIGGYSWFVLPSLDGIRLIFGFIFLIAGGIIAMASLSSREKRAGYLPLLLTMILSMGSILVAKSLLGFFFAWEMMTISSYLLVLSGKKAEKSALTYIVFALGGSFLLLAGFAIVSSGAQNIPLTAATGSSLAISLILLGFLIKLGAVGLHIWLPGAYAESPDDFSPIISGVLGKAGIFGLFLFATLLGQHYLFGVDIYYMLGWIGLLTAFFGTLMAIFQEDVKYLLAYSSMGQVGYIVLAFALMNHAGWTTALYLSVNHLLFKGLLFLAAAGVIYRTGTRDMYRMGGLIKRMPLSFISVLIGIIALSGVPPLMGFGGKWLIYTSLIEKGWYLQAGLALFVSAMAFLYCFRLIHTIFLGQPKERYSEIKEAPGWIIAPQYILIAAIMAFSAFPKLLIKPLSAAVVPFFSSAMAWEGSKLTNRLGYWNGNLVMMIVGAVFVLLLLLLLLIMRKPQKVKQFNIVYAAERPERPEVTHYAHNFYAPYNKALGFLIRPAVTRFWEGVSEGFRATGGALRMIYNGNAQTYLLHIVLFVVALYFVSGGF